MALITVTGTIKDPSGGFLSAGRISFALDDYFVAADGHIVPKHEAGVGLDPTTGEFSLDLESTMDGTPTTRKYAVMVIGKKESRLGDIQLQQTPLAQDLADILGYVLVPPPAVVEVPVDAEIPNELPDDARVVFTLDYVPILNSEMVHLNEFYQIRGVHYTILGATMTFAIPPATGDNIRVSYRKAV